MSYRIRSLETDEGWSVSCLDLPGCHSQGDSRDEALLKIREAIQLWLEVAATDQIHVVPEQAWARKQVNQQVNVAAVRGLVTGHGTEHRKVGSAVALGDHLQSMESALGRRSSSATPEPSTTAPLR